MRKLWMIVPFALALAVLAGCDRSGADSAGSTGGGGEAGVAAREAEPGGSGSVDKAQPTSAAVPAVRPQIVQTASLVLSIRHGTFDGKTDDARAIATSLGGFVVSSTASQGSDKRLVEGTLVLRVPERSYADAMQRLRRLGKVEGLDESGQDVSQEFVDLHARIRQLEAVEAQLLELLDRANDVPAALAVQSQLSQVQLDLEQARGRLNYLEDQVTYATISLSLHEAGVVAPRGGGFSIVDAWATAGAAFLTVVGWILVGVAVAAPLLVLAALGYVVARILRSRLAHT